MERYVKPEDGKRWVCPGTRHRPTARSCAEALFGSALLILAAVALSFIGPGHRGALAEAKPVIKTLTIDEGYKLVEESRNNPEFVVLDVRTESEFQEGHLENALNIDYQSDTFKEDLDKLDKAKTYFVYCWSVKRSGKAVQLMGELGFERIYILNGGYELWEMKGYPVVR